MNTIKTAFLVVALLGVGYGAYILMNKPEDDPPPGAAEQQEWLAAQMNDATTPSGPNVSMGAPQSMGTPQGQGPMVSLGAPADSLGGTGAMQPPTGPRAVAPPPIASMGTPRQDVQPVPSGPHAVDPTTGQPLDVAALGAANSAAMQPHGSHGSHSADTGGIQIARPNDDTAFLKAWQSAQHQLQSNMLADALFTLSAWYDHPAVTDEYKNPLTHLLDQLAGNVIYAPDSFDEPALAHRIERGETLESIAQRYNVPAELLARINGIDGPRDLIPTQTMKVIRGPFRAELSLSRREMTLYVGRYYAGRFPVSIGNDLPNVEATYEVAEKLRGRAYVDPRTGTTIPPNQPDNPYGAYWLGLRGPQSPGGGNVGLHGTAPVQDGREDLRGSAGLSPRGADDVFAILSLKSKVAVRR